jgi:hypothetical protein
MTILLFGQRLDNGVKNIFSPEALDLSCLSRSSKPQPGLQSFGIPPEFLDEGAGDPDVEKCGPLQGPESLARDAVRFLPD